MEWDNLFNYGEGNAINFEKLNGVVGIFGKNYSGKSSVVDSMLYTVYNSISKNNRKNLNIINQNKPSGCGRVEIDVAGKTYIIERKSEKYTRKLHGEETEEAKTDVEFTVIDPATNEETSLNSLDRNGTDKAIRKIFGSIDDFLLTSMSSQMGAMTFINEGSTKRKEILAKFLDLDQFEKKFKLSKNDSIETRALLKKLEDNTFDEDITQLLGQLTDNEKARETQERKCTKLTTELETISERVREIDGLFASAPVELINIGKETARLAAAGQEKSDYNLKAAQAKNQKKDVLEQAKVLKGLLDKTDVSVLKEKITECEGIQKELTSLEAEINLRETQRENYEKKVSILGEVPCGAEFSHCKFIKDAYESKSLLDACRKSLMALRRRHNQLTTKLEGMDVETLEQERKLYNDRDKEYADLCTEATNLDLSLAKIENKIHLLVNEMASIKTKIEVYELNKEAIENREELIKEQDDLKEKSIKMESDIAICETKVLDLVKQHGGIETQIANIKEKQQELEDLRTEYAAYDLFMRCTHPNGISYDVVKRMLPLINEEISTVLSNVTEFEVFFEAEKNKLDIFIKHPKYEARPLEMASGAEKTLAAIAIRIALTNVSTLPKSSLMVLDEPGTALDAENLEGFMRVLEMLKSYYDKILLITHLDSLKDCADMTIDITVEDGYAKVVQ
jgi:DNA repair exonuclease SbcCD ATPase subunit